MSLFWLAMAFKLFLLNTRTPTVGSKTTTRHAHTAAAHTRLLYLDSVAAAHRLERPLEEGVPTVKRRCYQSPFMLASTRSTLTSARVCVREGVCKQMLNKQICCCPTPLRRGGACACVLRSRGHSSVCFLSISTRACECVCERVYS